MITLKVLVFALCIVAMAAGLFIIWLGERYQNLSDDIDEMGDQ